MEDKYLNSRLFIIIFSHHTHTLCFIYDEFGVELVSFLITLLFVFLFKVQWSVWSIDSMTVSIHGVTLSSQTRGVSPNILMKIKLFIIIAGLFKTLSQIALFANEKYICLNIFSVKYLQQKVSEAGLEILFMIKMQ